MIDFEPYFASLREDGAPVRFFLRDDDADVDEPTLSRLVETCLRRTVPLSLAVIPATLSTDGAAYLLEQRTRHPQLLELHQHGWSHTNHEHTGRKCEFGPSRSYARQFADIASGRARMTDAFGPHWFPAFTPPWNRCTEMTCEALANLGFHVLSTDHVRGTASAYPFRQVPITFDLHRWKGGVTMKTPAEVRHQLGKQIVPGGAIGMLIHHKVMDDGAFDLLDALLANLRRHPRIEFRTLSQGTNHEA